jgi:hypothetical protein
MGQFVGRHRMVAKMMDSNIQTGAMLYGFVMCLHQHVTHLIIYESTGGVI